MIEQTPHLAPNQFSFPSAPNNNGMDFSNVHSLEGIPEMTAVGPLFDPEYQNYAPQGAANVLMEIRRNFPFLEIMPFPPVVKTVHLDPGVPKEIAIPNGMALCRFSGDGGYFVCIAGNAEIPLTSAGANDATSVDSQSKSIYKPEWNFFYLQGKSSVSMISAAGCNVSMSLWPMNVLPVIE